MTRRVLSDINSPHPRLSYQAWLNTHARLTRAGTRYSTRQNNQTIAAELWECSRRRRFSQTAGKVGKVSSGEQAHGCVVRDRDDHYSRVYVRLYLL
jgi:hypothetical protein